MPQTREDRIYLAYKAKQKAWAKEGVGQVSARAAIEVGKIFNISPLKVQQLANARRDENVKTQKK